MKIIPIILAGGRGRRLWPASHKARPKQFLSLVGKKTLFRQTLERCRHELFEEDLIIVGASEHRFLIAEELRASGATGDVILEPVSRNTGAAVAAGLLRALERSVNPILLIMPADHLKYDTEAFAASIKRASAAATSGHIVTFGVQPSNPSIELGYIRLGKPISDGGCIQIAEFAEKPCSETAKRFVKNGYLWNSGLFLVSAECLRTEFNRHAPGLFAYVKQAMQNAEKHAGNIKLNKGNFRSAPRISFDKAIMENTRSGAVFPVNYAWSDMGSWDAIFSALQKDNAGNAVVGDAKVTSGHDNLVFSDNRHCSVLGVDNCIVVSSHDKTLVMSRDCVEDVGALAREWQHDDLQHHWEARRIHRPWGHFDILARGAAYKVKRITVHPGEALSLQKHQHRSEHWVVVSGTAEVTLCDQAQTYEVDQSISIPVNTIHRLANNTREPLIVIEVQTGSFLSEEDIERYEDRYNRVSVER